ncbi:NADH:flavin oxidoreductase [Mucilaginibacter aquariorum]|uniref:NADH:flavin oxidoreductase n=1 Tax=Mucilaginibacter aquariorum TaxID=2967225 RepID=A0ABT1SXH0_9SPHI|nr:NADH:flavin oxidoreductase [Mucilaginibacter aquariorum]MCQ6957045.1 NADH:flavin oxidoreductase [Mucilaginibacter aquariorum]
MITQPLFSPFTYKNLTLKNRIIMPPMTRKHSPDGQPSEDMANYYARRAADAGMILSESTAINRPASKHYKNIPNFYGDGIKGWEKVIHLVHHHQGVMGPQLWHVGIAKPDPSGWMPPMHFEGPDMMTRGEIYATIDAFADAAMSAKNLGFDCVEIHAGHGYLIDQFFWQHTNHRRDSFGGKTLKERTAFAAEVVRAIRKKVGNEFVILIRLSQWKLQDYDVKLANTPNEMEDWLLPLAEAGADIFDCSQRRFWQPEFDGSDLSFAGWAKKITGQPSITVGAVGLSGEFLQSLFYGEGAQKTGFDELMRRFDRGEFDLVAVGRALLQDPQWISKIRKGRFDEIKDFNKDSLNQYY